jgi:hypothetical protein
VASSVTLNQLIQASLLLLAASGVNSVHASERTLAGWFSDPYQVIAAAGHLEVECIPVGKDQIAPGTFPAGTKIASGGAIVGPYSESGVTFISTLSAYSVPSLPPSMLGIRGRLFATLLDNSPDSDESVVSVSLQVEGVYTSRSGYSSTDLRILQPSGFIGAKLEFSHSSSTTLHPWSTIRSAGMTYVLDCTQN